jgi:hypothetical protein
MLHSPIESAATSGGVMWHGTGLLNVLSAGCSRSKLS